MAEPRKGARGGARGPTTGVVPKTPKKVAPKPKPKPIKTSAWAKGAAAPASIFYPDALTQPKKKPTPKPRSVVFKPSVVPQTPARPSSQEMARLARERRGLSLGVKGIDPTRQPKQDLRAVPKTVAKPKSTLGSILGAAKTGANLWVKAAKAPITVADYWAEGLDEAPAAFSNNAKQFAKWYGQGNLFGRTKQVAFETAAGRESLWNPGPMVAALGLDLVGIFAGEESQEWVMDRYRDDKRAKGWMTGVEVATALPFLRAGGALFKSAQALRAGNTLFKSAIIGSDHFPVSQPIVTGVRAVGRKARGDAVRGERLFQVGNLVKAVDASESPVGRAVEDVVDAARSGRSVERRVGGEIRLQNVTRRKMQERGVPNLKTAITRMGRGKHADAETFALRLALQGSSPQKAEVYHLTQAAAAETPEEAARHIIYSNLATAAKDFVNVTDEGVAFTGRASKHLREAHRLISTVTAPAREQFIRNLNLVTDEQIAARAAAPARVMSGAEWKQYEDIYRETVKANPSREQFRQGLIGNGRTEEEANAIVKMVDSILRSYIQARPGLRPQQVIDGVTGAWDEIALQIHEGDRIDPAYFDQQLRLGERDMPTEVLLNEIKQGATPEVKAFYTKRARALMRRHNAEDLPEGARSVSKIRDLLIDLRGRALEAELYRRWYATSASAILREAGGDKEKAIRLSMLFSIYSPRAAVWDPSEWNNTTRSLGAYDEFAATGQVSDKWQMDDWQTRAANIAMAEGRWVGEGRKTSSFAQNFIKYIDPERARAIFGDVDPGTMDTWMRRAFRYAKVPRKKRPKGMIEGQADLGIGVGADFGDEPITNRMYSFMEDATRDVADDMGWSIDEAQAAIWTSIKAEQEGTDLSRAGVDFEYGLRDVRAQQQAKANIQELPLDFETPFDASALPARPTGVAPEAENYERTLRQWVADKLGRAHQKHGVKGGKKKMSDAQYEAAIRDYLKYAERYPDDPELSAFVDLYEQARPAGGVGETDIPFHEVPDQPEINSPEFAQFFSDAVEGKHAPSFNPYWEFKGAGHQRFYDIFKRHGGNFDAHIDTSIPDYRGMMIRKGLALSEAFPGAKVLDLMGGEGSWGKTLSEHGMKTVTLDANNEMLAAFKRSPVPGARFVAQAFREGFDDGDTVWRAYNPKERFDIVNESMGFQFIGPERDVQFAEAKRLMRPGGLFITDEKVVTPKWAEFEAEKDAYKAQFYSQEAMADKAKAVLGENSTVGMTHNMATQKELEDALGRHFTHWQPYWESGNFRGYIASDDPETIARFLDEYNGQDVPIARPEDAAPGFEMQRVTLSPEAQAQQRAAFMRMEGLHDRWLAKGIQEDVGFHQVPEEGPRRIPSSGDAVQVRSTGQRGYVVRVRETGQILIRTEEGEAINVHLDDVDVTTPGAADFRGAQIEPDPDAEPINMEDWNAMARDVAATLPEEEWPTWVRNNLRKQQESELGDLPVNEEDDLQSLLRDARGRGLSSGPPAEAEEVAGETDMLDFEFALPPDAKLLTSREAANLDPKDWSEYVFHGTDPAAAEQIWAEKRLRLGHGRAHAAEGLPRHLFEPSAFTAENPRIAARYADSRTYDRGAGLPGDEESRGMVIAIPRSALPKGTMEAGNPYGTQNTIFGGQTFSSPDDILFQRAMTKILGAAEFVGDEGFILHKADTAGVWTITHELGHLLRRRLTPQQERSIARLSGATKNADGTYTWGRDAEEKFADMFVAAIYGSHKGGTSKRIALPPAMKRHAKVMREALQDEITKAEVVSLNPRAARAFESMLDYKQFEGGRFVGAEDIFADSNLVPIYVGYTRGIPTPLNESRVGRAIGRYQQALFSGGKRAIGRGPRDPRTENVFKAELLGSALFENTMNTAVDDIVIASRMVAAKRVRDEFLRASSELPSSPRDQPIKVDPDKNVSPELKRMYDIMAGLDEDLKWKPGDLEELNLEAAMAIQADLFPALVDGAPAAEVAAQAMQTLQPIDNIRWVPWEVVQRSDVLSAPAGALDSAAEGALKKTAVGAGMTIDAINDIGRAMLTYFNPAYVPMNLAGNLTMTLIHQGVWAPRNLTKAALLHRTMKPEDRTLIDSLMGTGFAQNIGFQLNVDVVKQSVNTVGHYLGLAIDLIPRRSAFLHEARKEGFDTTEKLTALLKSKDETSIAMAQKIASRAKEKMVDFERMSPLEQRLGRWILFYPWIRGATRYTARLAMDRPAEFALLVMLHDNAAAQSQQDLGERPTYAKETYPISTGSLGLGVPGVGRLSLADLVGERGWESGGYPMTINIRQAFPQTTPFEVVGQIKDIFDGKASIVENLQPGWQALGTAAIGYDTFYDKTVDRNFNTFLNQLLGQAPLPTAVGRIRQTPEQRAEANETRINPRTRNQDIARLATGSLTPQPYNPVSGQKAAALNEGDDATVYEIDLKRRAEKAGAGTPPKVVLEDIAWKTRLSKEARGKSDKDKAKVIARIFAERYPDRAAVVDEVDNLVTDEDYQWFYRELREQLYPELAIYEDTLGSR